ncbi:MAG: beta-galactosidase [Elusimicrobia bacterium]|nr:beta-galactosidase [Elusimicrobiota bacterium]
MNLGVQYYRAPFPEEKYWEKDFEQIKNSGLNTVQLWAIWAWIESKPGKFCFDDYDRLIELARKNNLGVIISTIAEIHPYWIHTEVPNSEMIDHMGRRVVSSNRSECHFGLTPGGCFDHPEVWNRMQCFLSEVVKRYRSADNLRGWDSWNELRWNVQSDGLVCFCDYTLDTFRKWLENKYNSLDELNRVWKRRYGSFSEIYPGKLPGRPYTEMMAFEHFITWRANQHGKNRYDTIKSLDPKHVVTAHGESSSILMGGSSGNHSINRGNDWFFADDMDGIGCSSFPKWFNLDDADFGMRIEFVKSAARDKLVWLSEIQGGRVATGFEPYESVEAISQQRWIWNGVACGADTLLFWCWRDEVFGYESSGFGISGDDGLAQERLSAMKETGKILEKYKNLILNYKPAKQEVGIMFSPQSYYLNWALEGNSNLCMDAIHGYARSLVRKSIPYIAVEEEHLNVLSDLKILFMPHNIVTDETTEEILIKFVKNGGTLVCESECGSFNSQGLYRYPVNRFTSKISGTNETGRRIFTTNYIKTNIADNKLKLGVTQWLTPWQKKEKAGKVLAENKEGVLIYEIPIEKGKLVLCGSYFGNSYLQNRSADFERFIELLSIEAGYNPEIQVISPTPKKNSFVYIKSGESLGKKVVFVFFPKDSKTTHLRFSKNFFHGKKIKDIITENNIPLSNTPKGQEIKINASKLKLSILTEI